jgi:hypothetical protein
LFRHCRHAVHLLLLRRRLPSLLRLGVRRLCHVSRRNIDKLAASTGAGMSMSLPASGPSRNLRHNLQLCWRRGGEQTACGCCCGRKRSLADSHLEQPPI